MSMAEVNFPNLQKSNNISKKYMYTMLETNNDRRKFKQLKTDRNNSKKSFFRTSSSEPMLKQFNNFVKRDKNTLNRLYSELIEKISIVRYIFENAPDIFNNLKEQILINKGTSTKINIEYLKSLSLGDLRNFKYYVDIYLDSKKSNQTEPITKRISGYDAIFRNKLLSISDINNELKKIEYTLKNQFVEELRQKIPDVCKKTHCDTTPFPYLNYGVNPSFLENTKGTFYGTTKGYNIILKELLEKYYPDRKYYPKDPRFLNLHV
jgi:hypothetical protein